MNKNHSLCNNHKNYYDFIYKTKYKKFLIKTTKTITNCELIHSHNSMGVFFSHTDLDELKENAPNHNIYLSLIVNNYMEFCAKVCFTAKAECSKEVTFLARDENGVPYNYSVEGTNINKEKLISYDCDIQSPSTSIEVSEDFVNRTKAIIQKVETTKFTNGYGSNTWTRGWDADYATTTFKSFDDFSQKSIKSFDTRKATNKDFKSNNRSIQERIKTMIEDGNDYDFVIEAFVIDVLNFGRSITNSESVENILNQYIKAGISKESLAEKIEKEYLTIYNKFFANLKNKEYWYPQISTDFVNMAYSMCYKIHNDNTLNFFDEIIQKLEIFIDKIFEKHE